MSVQLNRRPKRQQPQTPNGTFWQFPQFPGMQLLFALLAIFGSLHALSMLGIETYRSLHSTTEITRLSTDVAELQAEIDELAAIVTHGNDEVFLEQMARCYGFAYPDEVRFLTLVDVKDQPATGTVLCR